MLVMAVLLTVWGCSSKVNQANYDKIEIGMRYDEVVAILGEPVQNKAVLGTRSCGWGENPRVINIKFVADRVVFRSAKGLK